MKSWLQVLSAFAALAMGCATMGDVVKSKKDGTSQVYAVSADQAWDIAKAVFRWEGADAIEEHRNDGYMLTSSGINLASYGAVMGAWIERIDDNHANVTVVTKRRLSMNLATTLTETTFHKRFGQAAAIVKSGKPLPASSEDAQKVPYPGEAGQKKYQEYLAMKLPRAFAITETGHYGYASGTHPKDESVSSDPKVRALEFCNRKAAGAQCALYSVNDEIVFAK